MKGNNTTTILDATEDIDEDELLFASAGDNLDPDNNDTIMIPADDNGENLVRNLGKLIAPPYYAFQKARVAQSNRVRDVIRKKILGISDLTPEQKKKIIKEYNKFSDKELPKMLQDLIDTKRVTGSEAKYLKKLMVTLSDMAKIEYQYKKMMEQYLPTEIIWNEWLSGIHGIGPVLATNLIHHYGDTGRKIYRKDIIKPKKEGDQEKINLILIGQESNYPEFLKALKLYVEDTNVPKQYVYKGYNRVEALNSHSGMTPKGAKGRRRGQNGEKGITLEYSPKLKVLAWKTAESFVMKKTTPYRGRYERSKTYELNLMEQHGKGEQIYLGPDDTIPKYTCKNPKQVELRSQRLAAKLFLQHYYLVARILSGLKVTRPYAFNKLGHDWKHFTYPPNFPKKRVDEYLTDPNNILPDDELKDLL